MMIIFVTIFAFVLEFFLNSFLYDTIFVPLVVITSLVLLQPYFEKNNNKYYIYCFLVGLIYDFVYTGFYFMSWLALMLYTAESERFALIIPSMALLILSLIGFKVIKEASR